VVIYVYTVQCDYRSHFHFNVRMFPLYWYCRIVGSITSSFHVLYQYISTLYVRTVLT